MALERRPRSRGRPTKTSGGRRTCVDAVHGGGSLERRPERRGHRGPAPAAAAGGRSGGTVALEHVRLDGVRRYGRRGGPIAVEELEVDGALAAVEHHGGDAAVWAAEGRGLEPVLAGAGAVRPAGPVVAGGG